VSLFHGRSMPTTSQDRPPLFSLYALYTVREGSINWECGIFQSGAPGHHRVPSGVESFTFFTTMQQQQQKRNLRRKQEEASVASHTISTQSVLVGKAELSAIRDDAVVFCDPFTD
jgi:hypothetical protein